METYPYQTDNYLKNCLLRKEHFSALELILEQEVQTVQHLRQRDEEGKLQFSPAVPEEELVGLLSAVKKEVDLFLGSQEVSVPDCRYTKYGLINTAPLFVGGFFAVGLMYLLPSLPPDYNWYKLAIGAVVGLYTASWSLPEYAPKYESSLSCIKLPRSGKSRNQMADLAHEYAHHVQKEKLGLAASGASEIFNEGHAQGVARHIAEVLREKEDNEAFLYDLLEDSVAMLDSVYRWMGKRLKLPSREFPVQLTWRERLSPDQHSLGEALFRLYEQKVGKSIYREVLQGRFQFR